MKDLRCKNISCTSSSGTLLAKEDIQDGVLAIKCKKCGVINEVYYRDSKVFEVKIKDPRGMQPKNS